MGNWLCGTRFSMVVPKRTKLKHSTVLFIEGHPVGYEVVRDAADRFNLHPAENASRLVKAPQLQLQLADGNWLVLGTHDEDLIQQVKFRVANTNDTRPFALTASP